jgi:uncharacterized protein YecT (DUF1311 family)
MIAVMKIFAFLMLMLVCSPASFSQTTGEMKDDASHAYAVSDKAMNAAYAQLMVVLNEEGKKRLREDIARFKGIY